MSKDYLSVEELSQELLALPDMLRQNETIVGGKRVVYDPEQCDFVPAEEQDYLAPDNHRPLNFED